uniref:G-protein coupled receptors family 1 profile domain-containing protein n=1 Tax=Fundulus heteroclitus TaxID=8078 RepID=A0A3Q2NQK7_FUNHE
MLPVSLLSSENGQGLKMFAVVEQWDEASDRHTDNTNKYFMLLLIKLGLEAGVFYSCGTKKCTYFLSVCSLSVLLADFVVTFLMGAAWFLGAEKSLVSPCALLANASTAYAALPLPMMLLGFVDYCLEDIFMSDRPALWRTLRNVLLTLVVWAVAVNHSLHSSYVGPVELDSVREKKALACEVRESALITVFTLGLFTATLLTLVPFLTRIPRWVREAHKLTEAREEQKNAGSDLMMLGFLLFWMPYLLMSVSCLIFGLGIPAYLSVNLLWLECSNSFLVGLVFWAKSSARGPYSSLPDNDCNSWKCCHDSSPIQSSYC